MSLNVVCYALLRVQTKRICTEPVSLKYKTKFTSCRQSTLGIQRLLSTEANYYSKDSREITSEFGPKENFITVYKYPYIKYVSLVNRSKQIYLNKFLPIALPISFGIYCFDLTSSASFYSLILMGMVYGVNLHLLAHYAQNTVGFVYASQDTATVQIAYVDSEGRRKDEVVPSNDIIPLSEIPSSFSDKFYSKVMRHSKPKTEILKLDLVHGEILDKDRFQKIFGTV